MTTDMPEMSVPFVLYGSQRSANVYKPALMLSLCGLPFTFKLVDLAAGEQRSDEFRKLNPMGQVPVLTHGDLSLRQSNAMLDYLSVRTGKFGGENPVEALRIQEWLYWEQDMLFWGIGRTRFFSKVMQGDPAVVSFFRSVGERAVTMLEEALERTPFLVGTRPTIADLSVYGYARLAEDADLDLSGRPRTVAWRESIEALPGWKSPQELLV